MIRLLPLLLLLLPIPRLAPADVPEIPDAWNETDWAVPPARYAVEAARFPSSELASGVQAALLNQGWAPVRLVQVPGGVAVMVGNFDSAAEASYIMRELAAQQTAVGVVAALPAGSAASEAEIDGPLLEPFLPTPGVGPKAPDLREALRRARLARDQIETDELEVFDYGLATLELQEDGDSRGAAAARVARALYESQAAPEAALTLAGLVARGEWEAADKFRLDAGEVVADLYYGHRRDWRAAWSATNALMNDRKRSPDGVMRDSLRRAALMVELAASGESVRPTFPQVRAVLRRAWDEPAVDDRTRIKLELIYLQTFAWQGMWRRVDNVGREFAGRSRAFPYEQALGRLMIARSLERTQRYDAALEIIRQVIATEFPRDQKPLTMGVKVRDLHADARRLAVKFRELKLRAEGGLLPDEKAPPAVEDPSAEEPAA